MTGTIIAIVAFIIAIVALIIAVANFWYTCWVDVHNDDDKYEVSFGQRERKHDLGMSVQRAEFNELKERVDRVYDQITDVANIAANGDMNALLQHKIRERFGDYQQPTQIGQIGKRR